MKHKKNILTEFAWGIIIGFLIAVIAFGVISVKIYLDYKKKELVENVQRQMAIEELREEINSLDVADIVDTVPGVSGAVDGATAEFERRRDEILQRFRSRIID